MNTAKKLPPPDQVQQLFDETLNKHLKTLTGEVIWIGTQPLNVVNIACLVSLAEREAEIETSPDDPPERFSLDSLIDELNEIIPDFDEDLNSTIQQFIDDKCVKEEEEFLVASSPVLKIAKVLNSVFPQMPGLNLVAYIIQTIGEVISGRKDLDAGHSQFNQILLRHGINLSEKSGKEDQFNIASLEKLDPEALLKAREKQAKKRSQAKQLLHSYAKRQQKSVTTLKSQSSSVFKSFDSTTISNNPEFVDSQDHPPR